MFTKSLRWKIHAWHGALLIITTVLLLGSFYSYEWRQGMDQLDKELAHRLITILPGLDQALHFRPPPPPGEPPRDHRMQHEAEVLDELDSSAVYYVVFSEEDRVERHSKNAPFHVSPPDRVSAIDRERNVQSNRTREGYRETIYPLPEGKRVVLGIPLSALKAKMKPLAMELTFTGLGIIGFGLAGGWWLAGRAIRPIAVISATAEKISRGDLTQRINISETESELGQLATVLNQTFSQLLEGFQRQVQFTADASHELRTPISVIIAELDYALSRERSNESYRESIVTCRNAAERMKHLVSSLLDLARADAAGLELMIEPCDLALLAGEAVEFIQPLAQERNAKIETHLGAAPIRADYEKLTRALINLLTNAVVHNPDGTLITVSARVTGSEAVVVVEDNGRGISEEALPHLCERFYREDKARSRSIVQGGAGLGLAIIKAIVESHHGVMSITSHQGKGSRFEIRFPLEQTA